MDGSTSSWTCGQKVVTGTNSTALTTRTKEIGKQMGSATDQEDVESSVGNVAPLEQSGAFNSRNKEGRNGGGNAGAQASRGRSTCNNGREILSTLEQAPKQYTNPGATQEAGLDRNSKIDP